MEIRRRVSIGQKVAGTAKALRRDGKQRHFVKVPLEAVKAVYLGLRTSSRTRDQILASLRLRGREHILLHGMCRHRENYAIVPVPWSEITPVSGKAVTDFESIWTHVGFDGIV